MRFNQNAVLAIVAVSIAVSTGAGMAQERDPFVSLLDLQQQKMKVDLSGVLLKGIIWEARSPVAIINDTLVTVGDDFFGFKVDRIAKDRVTLTMGQETYVLEIEDASIQDKEVNRQEEVLAQKEPDTRFLAPPALDGQRPYENPAPDIQR